MFVASFVTHQLHPPSSSEEGDFPSPSHPPDIKHAVKEAIGQVQLYPEIRPVSHRKRSPIDRSGEGPSSARDGDEEYCSTQFGESSGDEEEGLYLPSEEWEMVSI